MIFVYLLVTTGLASAGKSWSNRQDYHHHDNHVHVGGKQESHLQRLDVVCSKDHMTVNMEFDNPFYGVVFSHPSPHHERCIHVGPRAGVREVTFHIKYDSCGTVEDLRGQFHENTIVIQFGEDILEAWDEAKRLRCEWLESFEKPSSKPTLAISDIDVVELNFQGDDIDCWMEIQEGKGPWARQVGGLVPIGSPLTLVIAINDNSREFDMRVKKCSASDGTHAEIELTDHNGCVLRSSLLTPFAKIRDFGGKATLVAYSHIYAFKFPDTLDVFVHCIVEVCRHGCHDSCGGKTLEDYRPHSGTYDSLESKKYHKLAQLANSKASSVHHFHATQVLQAAASNKAESYVQPLPGRERHKSTVVHENHNKLNKTVINHSTTLIKGTESTFSKTVETSKFVPSDSHKSIIHEEKGSVQSSPTNIHLVLADVKNGVHSSEKITPFVSPYHHDIHQTKSNVHKIIGHDAHWNAEAFDVLLKDKSKHKAPALSFDEPKPEPAAWSADEIKPLSRDEVFHKRIPITNDKFRHKAPDLLLDEPKPEPAAWSADEVKPLSRDEVFHKTRIPIPKTEIFTNPKPEPSPWTFEEVNPMHNPHRSRPTLEKERIEEPKPEPAAWSLDDVKPLTKEDLKAHSLNYKLKSNSHLPLSIPAYREHVVPFSSTASPQPVYVQTKMSQNMSSPMMMKMMMMPTLLPYTYQTARWPQKTTARFLSHNRHHYPYPIPQFSPRQQLMMSVIADRRMDNDESEHETAASIEHHNDKIDPRNRILIGGTLSDVMESRDGGSLPDVMESRDSGNLSDVMESRNGGSLSDVMVSREEYSEVTSNKENVAEKVSDDVEDVTKPIKTEIGDERLPIKSFVPPSFDDGLIESQIQAKEVLEHIPRALNRKKRSDSVFGVRQKFQAIASSDLAFDFNLTTDSTATLRGRREEIVYGICMSQASVSTGVGFILILTLCALIASAILYEHSCRLSNKTSHLSLLTRTFNGRLENLYKISRHRTNSTNRDTG